jgi:hypothetical protein
MRFSWVTENWIRRTIKWLEGFLPKPVTASDLDELSDDEIVELLRILIPRRKWDPIPEEPEEGNWDVVVLTGGDVQTSVPDKPGLYVFPSGQMLWVKHNK